ncbi:hypothetical protein C8R45DRAFT_455769 [Mycena sanguinolenta]|nr:hypothetical protein C8R45DRAFT_455769 [Mycena sanguinolenta]
MHSVSPMTLPSASTSALVEPTKRKKKPACDACKARRVLCHRQPEGIPCPRCAEKGIICKTSTVQRGRPRKVDELPSPPTTPEEALLQQPLATSSGCNCSTIAVRPRIELSNPLDLSPELVKHLFDCILLFPQSQHCFFSSDALKIALHSASYQLNLLPLQSRVVATCICALSATISFHPSIIGPSTIASFKDPATFFAGADLRAYGVRRAPMYRALYEHAFALACEARIQVDVSADNAASCFLLDVLERLNAAPSRPWAVSFVSHARILAAKDFRRPGSHYRWNHYNDMMFAEALAAMARRTPVLFTYNDQLLLSESEPSTLEQLLQSLQAMSQASKKVAHLAFTAIRPYMFHVTRLARDLHDKISGDYARRRPLAEDAVISFLSSLSLLQSILCLVLTYPDLSSADAEVMFYGQNHTQRREMDNVRACVFVISIGFTSLVIALHKEVAYRVRQADEATTSIVIAETSTATQPQTRWAHERLRTIDRQVREMAGQAVGDVARTLQLLPSLPHLAYLDWSCVQDWADFCVAEAAESGTVDGERARVMGTFISALKLFGYSCEIQRSGELITQMEAFVGQHRAADNDSAFNSGGNDANSAFNAQLFALDGSWAGMFDFASGQQGCGLEGLGFM